MAIPWQLRIVIIMNRKAGLNLLVHAATEAIQQWARDIKKMRMGILIVIHTFGGWNTGMLEYWTKAKIFNPKVPSFHHSMEVA